MKKKEGNDKVAITVKKRPVRLHGVTRKAKCGCGNIYITINEYQGKPFEVFIGFGKSGTCTHTTMGALAIALSHGLRYGLPLEEFSRAFSGFQCEKAINRIEGQGKAAYSCIDAIAKVFNAYLEERGELEPSTESKAETAGVEVTDIDKQEEAVEDREIRGGVTCSQCGGPVYFASGCDHCVVCGHSENCE